MHEEARRLDIQLFGYVLADLDQRRAALPTGAGERFMHVLNARQMIRQRLTAGARTRYAWRRLGTGGGLGLFLGEFGLGRSQIARQRLLEQIAFFGRESFAAGSEAHPAQVRELQREGLDLDLGGVKLGVAAGDLFAQPKRFGGLFLCLIDEVLNGAEDPIREFGRASSACKSMPILYLRTERKGA
jgi:hypothetical protein